MKEADKIDQKSASQTAIDKALAGQSLTTDQFLLLAAVMAIRELTVEVIKLKE